jgi:hypothetical protein
MRIPLLVIGIAALAAPAIAADAAFGSFVLDPAQSGGGERCAVTALEDLGNGKFRFSETRIDADGKAVHRDGVFAFDGGDHPDGSGGSLAFTRIDDARYAMVSKGTLRATAMRTLSGDTLTETVDGSDDGDAFHAAHVYTRGSGSCEADPSRPK